MRKIIWSKYVGFAPIQDDESNQDGSPFFFFPAIRKHLEAKYNFWEADINFDLTVELATNIAQVKGVESLDPFSRYKFRVGIGKLFDEDDVKQEISRVCGCMSAEQLFNLLDEKTKEKAEQARSVLKDYKYWFIFVLPNGSLETCHTNNPKEYKKRLKLIEKVRENVTGTLIEYDT